METRQFFSKLLLFGEYTVLLGSDALAVPFIGFGGQFSIGGTDSASSDGVKKLLQHIEAHNVLRSLFDLHRWQAEERQGLFFHSTIPQGYGLGSSGALVAAAFDRYGREIPDDLPEIKRILALMENAFHGASSGIDPLVSYLNTPLLLLRSGGITPLPPLSWSEPLWLLDTGIPRSTEKLVARFHEKMASDSVFTSGMAEITSCNQQAIDAVLSADGARVRDALRTVSELQFRYMQYAIPEHIKPLWEEGLSTGAYSMKLCGAGGGGMVIVSGDMTSLAHKGKNELSLHQVY